MFNEDIEQFAPVQVLMPSRKSHNFNDLADCASDLPCIGGQCISRGLDLRRRMRHWLHLLELHLCAIPRRGRRFRRVLELQSWPRLYRQ